MDVRDIPISKDVFFDVINSLTSDARGVAQTGVPATDSSPSWLNPQPLPPMPAGYSTPQPLRAAAVARYVVRMAAVARAGAPTADEGMRAARDILRAFVDDFTGSVPGGEFALPPGWPRIDVKPAPLDVLVAAARLHVAAAAMKGDALGADLTTSADRLLNVGLSALMRSLHGESGPSAHK